MTSASIRSASKVAGQEVFFRFALVVLIGCLIGFYLLFAEREVPPWDPSSMVILTENLSQGIGIQYQDAHNSQIGPYFNPHGFDTRSASDPNPYSIFPPGFSLLLVPAYLLGGLTALYLVPPLLSSIALAAAAYLGWTLAGRWGAVFSVLLIGTSRVVATFATSLWSDGPSLVLLMLGLALYVTGQSARRNRWLFGSGIVFGLMISTKFVNIVYAGLVLLFSCVRARWRQVILLGAGMLPGLCILLIYQAQAYGGPLTNAYQAWGHSLYDFPLFSIRYLFERAPLPWNDISSQAIAVGMLRDMSGWIALAFVGLTIRWRSPNHVMLAMVCALNIALYAVSVFTPRQFINMRYLLPALAVGYLFAAVALAWVLQRIRNMAMRVVLVSVVGIFCIGQLAFVVAPELVQRNQGTAQHTRAVVKTAESFARAPVVLAYNTADTFILYGRVSVLNYRRVDAPSIAERNRLVIDAIEKLLAENTPVYLVQDDEILFRSIYTDLTRHFALRQLQTPLTAYEIRPLTEAE
jgi:hypothetical protein